MDSMDTVYFNIRKMDSNKSFTFVWDETVASKRFQDIFILHK